MSRSGRAARVGGGCLVQKSPAEVVVPAHEQRPAPARWKRRRDQRQVVWSQLPLQGLGLGADHHALAGRGAKVRRRQQVGEALAHARALLKEADAAGLEHLFRGAGELHLFCLLRKPGRRAARPGSAAPLPWPLPTSPQPELSSSSSAPSSTRPSRPAATGRVTGLAWGRSISPTGDAACDASSGAISKPIEQGRRGSHSTASSRRRSSAPSPATRAAVRRPKQLGGRPLGVWESSV